MLIEELVQVYNTLQASARLSGMSYSIVQFYLLHNCQSYMWYLIVSLNICSLITWNEFSTFKFGTFDKTSFLFNIIQSCVVHSCPAHEIHPQNIYAFDFNCPWDAYTSSENYELHQIQEKNALLFPSRFGIWLIELIWWLKWFHTHSGNLLTD